jgi:UDP-GlcNAc:undecaprenyl-phosphate GlcNAc-1-phosphate transferase
VAVIVALVLAISAALAGQIFVPALALILVGAMAGFLVFNFPPARIFMGDAGSLVIGFLIGVLTILTTFHDPSRSVTPLGVFVPPVVLAVPLYDFISVIWLRRREGVSIFRGDHRHFSHRLSRRGLSARATVLTVYLATASTALPALLLPNSSWPRSLLILGQCVCVVALVAILEQGGPRNGGQA